MLLLKQMMKRSCLLRQRSSRGSAAVDDRGRARGPVLRGTARLVRRVESDDWTVQHRTSDLSVLAWLPWYYGFGVGGELRYEIFVLPTGFIPTINDAFSIEPSIGLAYTAYGVPHYTWSVTDIAPALYGIWSFYFSTPFRLYLGLGLGYNIGIATAPRGYDGTIADSYFYWDPAGRPQLQVREEHRLPRRARHAGRQGRAFVLLLAEG